MRADNNQAAGSNARAEGTNTSASGASSHAEGQNTTATSARAHAEGFNTQATNTAAHAEGTTSQATGSASHAEGDTTVSSGQSTHAEGSATNASGDSSHAEGYGSTAAGSYSHGQGMYAAAARHAQHAHAAGRFATTGDAQACVYVARAQTTDATPTVLTFTGAAAVTSGEGANVLTIPTDKAYGLRITITARQTGQASGVAGTWSLVGQYSRGSGSPALALQRQSGAAADGAADFQGPANAASAWLIAVANDGTGNYLKITVTGEAAKTIRWVARIETVEVG